METLMDTKTRPSRRYSAKRILRRVTLHALDGAAFALAGFFAFELRFDGAVPYKYFHLMGVFISVWVIAKSILFTAAKLDRGNWRYTSAYDAARIVLANLAGSIAGGLVIFLIFGVSSVPRSVNILDWVLSCLFTLGVRLVVRVTLTARLRRRTEGRGTRTLIYGAGTAGLALLWEIRQNPSLNMDVVGLIDDDPSKSRLILQGKRVFGTGESLAEVVRSQRVKRVLIAIPSATGPEMLRILKFALDADVQYKTVPGLGDLLQGKGLGKQIRDVAVVDLLGRSPVHLDQDHIRRRIQGKVVMVTGAGGSIGSELCRQIAQFRPRALVGFDAAETPLFHIEREMARSFPAMVFHPEIGNITRNDDLDRVMRHHKPTIVYHAAAYKHVPMMERHVFAAIENNVFGTWQVALAAAKHGVEDFVMISTDKAVRPTSMMGATKRVAELAIRSLQKERGTKFVAVRFGNVLGSNGSVVPIFKEQIAAGGPLTVTHPEMCRYFMTIPEAAQLVLQAFSIGKGGEVFVLDMGKPVKIVDLATNLILLSGLKPNVDIKIQFTGMRPGEKLIEELNLEDEHLVPTSHVKIRSYVSPYNLDVSQIKTFMHEIQQATNNRDVTRLVQILTDLIPDYTPDSNLGGVIAPVQRDGCEPADAQVLVASVETYPQKPLRWLDRVN